MFYFIFLTILGEIIEPFGLIDSGFYSVCGDVFQITGIVVGLVCGYFLAEKYHLMKTFCIISPVIVLMGMGVFTWACTISSGTFILIAAGILGAANFLVLAFAFEMAVYQTAPLVGEALASSFMNCAGNVYATVVVYSLDPLLSKEKKIDSFVVIGVFCIGLCLEITLLSISKVEPEYANRSIKEIKDAMELKV